MSSTAFPRDDPSPAYTAEAQNAANTWLNSSRRLPNPPSRTHHTSLSIDSAVSSSSAASTEVHKVVHSYTLTVGSAELTFIITIERAAAHLSEHHFFLSMKIGAVERPISQSVTLTLTIDPRDLTFAVFAFPPKPCMPQGCLYSLRVWLRANGVDHRIFSEDALWVGADPDFYCIENAAFARPRSVGATVHVYQVAIGKTLVDLVIRWRRVMEKAFSISLEYEARGVGRILFENLTVRLDCSPQEIDFVIYTMPISSTPQGASHRLRLWLRGPRQSSGPPYRPVDGRSASSVCQRIWSTDDFKLGDMLDFTALGPKLIMGVPTLNGPLSVTSVSEQSLRHIDGKPANVKASSREYTNARKEVL